MKHVPTWNHDIVEHARRSIAEDTVVADGAGIVSEAENGADATDKELLGKLGTLFRFDVVVLEVHHAIPCVFALVVGIYNCECRQLVRHHGCVAQQSTTEDNHKLAIGLHRIHPRLDKDLRCEPSVVLDIDLQLLQLCSAVFKLYISIFSFDAIERAIDAMSIVGNAA